MTNGIRTLRSVVTPHSGSKLPVVRTLIVGGGPAGLKAAELADALPLKHTGRSGDLRLAVVGGRGIFSPMAQSNRGQLMGQPGFLLETNQRRMNPDYAGPFMPAAAFVRAELQKEQQLHDRGTLFVDDMVVKIRKYGPNDFLVATRNGDEFVAQSIVLATGGGAQTTASSLGLARRKPEKQRRPFIEDMDALNFLMTGGAAMGGTTLILGGGPSAAWAAAEAKRRHNEVIWVASREHGGFKGADPGGRNTAILRALRGNMYFGKLAQILFRNIQDPGDASNGGIIAQIEGFQRAEDSGNGRETELIVSQVVTAFGADDTRNFSILEGDLFLNLEAIADVHGAFTKSPLDAAIGLRSTDGDLLTAGAASFRALLAKGHSMRWDPIALTLPQLARPSEGIAMAHVTAEALANVLSIESPNLFLINRNQFAYLLAKLTRMSEAGRYEIADKFIEMRSKLKPGQFSIESLAEILKKVDL